MEVKLNNLKIAEDMLENHIEAKEYNDAMLLANDILISFPDNEKAIFYSGYLSVMSKHFNLIKTFTPVDKNFDLTIKLLQESNDSEEEKTMRYENYINKVVKVLQSCKDKLYNKVYPNNQIQPDFSTEHMHNAYDLYTNTMAKFIKKFWENHLDTPLYEISKTKLANLKRDVLRSIEWPISIIGNNLIYNEDDLEPVEKYFKLYDLYTNKRMNWLCSTYPDKCKSWEELEPRFLEFKKEVKDFFKRSNAEEHRLKMEYEKAFMLSKNKIQKQLFEVENKNVDFLRRIVAIIDEYAIKKRNNGWIKDMTYPHIDLVNPTLIEYKEERRRKEEAIYKEEYSKYLDVNIDLNYITNYTYHK
jgi:hypothetical protein